MLGLLRDSFFLCNNCHISLDQKVICQYLDICWSIHALTEGFEVELQTSHNRLPKLAESLARIELHCPRLTQPVDLVKILVKHTLPQCNGLLAACTKLLMSLALGHQTKIYNKMLMHIGSDDPCGGWESSPLTDTAIPLPATPPTTPTLPTLPPLTTAATAAPTKVKEARAANMASAECCALK